jgi:hypothetical protein
LLVKGLQRELHNSERLDSRRAAAKESIATLFRSFGVCIVLSLLLAFGSTSLSAQTRTYPKEIRGYKVERAVVEITRPEPKTVPTSSTTKPRQNQTEPQTQAQTQNQSQKTDAQQTVNPPSSYADDDALIKLGKPQLARITPLGITFEVPIIVAPVKQSGHIDFLLFEDMVVNGRSVEIDEYHREFDLPNKHPLTLREPLRFYIYLPGAILAAVDEWSDSKETWPVTGRIYVCGKFKKFGFKFKRCIPVELNVTMRNPLNVN